MDVKIHFFRFTDLFIIYVNQYLGLYVQLNCLLLRAIEDCLYSFFPNPQKESKRLLFVRPPTLPVVRGTRRANESVKKQKDINDKRFSFVLAFESLAGRAKGRVLIFCFVLHQGKMKNKPNRVR